VGVLYSVENVSNLEIGNIFSLHTWHNLVYGREMDSK
jgi:hypothetical protein